jgi:hypothetical protein
MRTFVVALVLSLVPGVWRQGWAGVVLNPEASRQLLADFDRVYALPDDKLLKRVLAPFTPGRMEYYRVHRAEQAKYIPVDEAAILKHVAEQTGLTFSEKPRQVRVLLVERDG